MGSQLNQPHMFYLPSDKKTEALAGRASDRQYCVVQRQLTAALQPYAISADDVMLDRH